MIMMKSTQDWALMTEKSIAYSRSHFILIKPVSEPEHEETVILEEIKPHQIGTVSSQRTWSQLRTDLTATFPSKAQMRVHDFRNLRLAWLIKYVACGLFYYLRTQPCARLRGAHTRIYIYTYIYILGMICKVIPYKSNKIVLTVIGKSDFLNAVPSDWRWLVPSTVLASRPKCSHL